MTTRVPQDLLTLGQAADFMGRSRQTIRRWVRAGELPGTVRVKQRLLIPRSSLLAMFEPVEPETF